jgi:Ca2+-binding EF-hand superfamily protein
VGSGSDSRAIKALFEHIDGPEKYGTIDVNAMLDWAESKGITLTEQEAADFIAIGEASDNMLDAKQFQQAVQRLLGTSAAGARDGGAVPSAQVLGASQRGRGGQAPSAAEPSVSAFAKLVNSRIGDGDISQSSLKLFREVDSEQLGTIDSVALSAWANRLKVDVNVQDVERFIESANPGTFAPTEGNLTAVNRT